jgi:CxxC motif-containing protein (DUF1111 family)
MWANLRLYLIGLAVTLGPLAVRVLTLPTPEEHDASPAAIAAGRDLFVHEWKANDPMCPEGDGLGPVFNANSCVACHHQGGPGGSGGLAANVTTFAIEPANRAAPPRQGVVHAFASERRYLETLKLLDNQLPATSRPTLAFIQEQARRQRGRGSRSCFPVVATDVLHLSQRNTPALFGSRLIDEIPDRVIIAEERRQQLRWGLQEATTETAPVGRALRLGQGRVGKFGWKGQSPSLAAFVQTACANELGLGNPGQSQPSPLPALDFRARGYDLTLQQCDQITAFCASLPSPVERIPQDSTQANQARTGKSLFETVGCAHCHTPELGSVKGLYSDLLLHRMGQELQGDGSYDDDPIPPPPSPDGTIPPLPLADEWRTPPLWGVADSAPYLHDGRAPTLAAAILAHGGQAAAANSRFQALSEPQQQQLIAFLETLRAPQVHKPSPPR